MTMISRSALGLAPAAVEPEPQARTATPHTALMAITPFVNLGELCLTDPDNLDLCIYRGDTGRFQVDVVNADGTPANISGATWDCDIRATADSTTVLATLTVAPVGGSTSAVIVTLPAAASSALEPMTPPAVWDLQMTLSGNVETLLRGNVTVTEDVSRT
jgi:hypothetical protein